MDYQRLRARSGIFLSLLAVVAIVTAVGVGLVGFLRISATDAVRSEFSSATGTAAGFQVRQLRSAHGDDQDRAMRDAIATVFTADGRVTPLDVRRMLEAPADALTFTVVDRADAGPLSAAVMSIPELTDRAELVDGAWPSSRLEASMQADAAALLALAPGDAIQLGTVQLTLAGTWRVRDALDPHWMGSPLLVAGVADYLGPLVVDEATWQDMDVTPTAVWTIVPDATRLDPSDLSIIVTAGDDLGSALRHASDTDLGFPKVQGQLDTTAQGMLAHVNALRAIEPVAILTVAAMALATLLEFARLLGSARASENWLLWSRGASERFFVRGILLESGISAVTGAALGTGIAVAVLMQRAGQSAVLGVGPELWTVPVLVILATVLIFSGASYRMSRLSDSRDPTTSGRRRTAVGAGVVALIVLAAAASTWQLLLYGSPVTPVVGGGTGVDPFVVFAPSLVMVAIALLGMIAFPAAARLAERVATSATRLADVIALRTVARTVQLAATPIVLVSLACGQMIIASTYQATWSHASTVATELRAGAAIHLLSTKGIDESVRELATNTPGVNSTASVTVETARVGSRTIHLVGATPYALSQVSNDANGAFDGAAAAAAVETDLNAPTLPHSTHAVTLTVTTDGMTAPPHIALRLSDASGATLVLPLSLAPPPALENPTLDDPASTATYHGIVPTSAAEEGWLILAIDVLPGATYDGSREPTFALDRLDAANENGASTEISLGRYWIPESIPLREARVVSASAGRGFVSDPGLGLVRMLPSFDREPSDGAAARVVVSQALAERYSLKVGRFFTLDPSGPAPPVSAYVTAVIPAVPGVDDERSMLVDLHLLQALELRVAETPTPSTILWVAAEDAAEVAPALRASVPGNVQLFSVATDPSVAMLASAAFALWLAAAGSVLLAAFAVGATAANVLRARRREVVVLRAIGVSPKTIGTIRRREFWVVLGYATVIGLLIGVAVTYLMVPLFARAAVPNRYADISVSVQLNPVVTLGALSAIAAVLTCVIVFYASRVIAQARAMSTPGEES